MIILLEVICMYRMICVIALASIVATVNYAQSLNESTPMSEKIFRFVDSSEPGTYCPNCDTSNAQSTASDGKKDYIFAPPTIFENATKVAVNGEVLNYTGIVQKETPMPMTSSEILAAHNTYRSEVGLAPLTWSNTLESYAQNWANYLIANNLFQHSSGNPYGENLAAGSYTDTQLVGLWGAEKPCFKCGTFPDVYTGIGLCTDWTKVGHYTQMIWPTTTQIGCAAASSSSYLYGKVLVCEYNPPGNWIGTYICPTSMPTWTSRGGIVSFTNPYDRPATFGNRVFVRGSDGHLWVNKEAYWYDLGGIIVGSPSTPLFTIDSIPVLVRGSDDGLWECDIPLISFVPSWKSLGGKITSSPSLAGAVVSARGSDGKLWMYNYISKGWTGLGGLIVGNPVTVELGYASGHDVYLTFVQGTDNSLWVNKADLLDSGAVMNLGWTYLGGKIWSDPKTTGLNFVSNRIEIFATDRSSSHSLWMNNFDPTTMTGTWHSMGGGILPNSYPSVGQSSDSSKTYLVVRDTDSRAWMCSIPTSDITNEAWRPLGGAFNSDLNILSGVYSNEIWGVGTDNALWYTSLTV
jgi:uncharacterized protein YkwD